MKSVYINSSVPEKLSKERFKIPENIMMENAASALEEAVFHLAESTAQNQSAELPKVFIVCGSGNNGGDGFALARRLFKKTDVYVTLISNPKTDEAKIQLECIQALGISLLNKEDFLTKLEEVTSGTKTNNTSRNPIIVDCIFGTGFHGELPENILSLINKLNSAKAKRLACDISSGLAFNADLTVTMGALKTSLFSDNAKAVSGKIIVADLGIGDKTFEQVMPPDAFLIEKTDIKLPWRNEKSAHKGKYGHFSVIAGEKAGAGIIAATAALNFGAGLVTLLKSENSNLEQFKVSPELMISTVDSIPEKTSAIGVGSGLGNPSEKTLESFTKWFLSVKNPACVIDADFFSFEGIPSLLEKLDSTPDARIILTPHLKEFSSLCRLTGAGEVSVSELSDNIALRMELGKKICEKYKNTVLVIKSANTLIFSCNRGLSPQFNTRGLSPLKANIFICADGTPSLAKAGSGDVLAGICGSLLAQGYSAEEAAIIGVEAHALAGASFDEGTGFDMTPLKLINRL